MSVSSILNTGANGLQTAQFATNVASNNASNVNTPGFARRTTNIQSQTNGANAGGGGSRAVGISRNVDQFLERRVLGARAALGQASAQQLALGPLDLLFADLEAGIGGSLDNFEAAVANFASNPSDSAARSNLLAIAQNLATSFNQAAVGLSETRADANERARVEIDSINQKLRDIASLNQQISAGAGNPAGSAELMDRRDALVRDLAKQVPIKTIDDPQGGVSILLNGMQTLVSPDGAVTPLGIDYDAGGDLKVTLTQVGIQSDITSQITGGTLGGLLAARGTIIEAQNKVDQLAYDITSAYNAVHSTGYALDGSTGRNLFEPLTSSAGAAAAMALSSDVAGQPEALAAATDPAEVPGDNRAALALQALATSNIAGGGTTSANGAFSQIISFVGTAVSTANSAVEQAGAMSEQLDALAESVSGVSLDDEMVSLMKFQRAYQASMRVIETADEMLSDLINMKR